MKKNKQGFTLIELLVVIAIIGLLSTLSIVALNSARARSRDARRVSDIKQIQTALEMYYNEVGSYPATGLNSTTAISNGTSVFMAKIPGNATPTNDGSCGAALFDYTYAQTSSGASYTLVYCLGAATGGIPANTNTATPAGIKL